MLDCLIVALKSSGAAVTLIWVVHLVVEFLKNLKEREHLNSLRRRKQLERDRQFKSYKEKYPQEATDNEKVLNLSFSGLRSKLQSRELTTEEVLRAFTAKSLQVQQEFNCITEFNPHAFEQAKQLDSLDKPKGPLHGIPFCVKDDTFVKDMDSTCGFSALLYKPSEESAVIVQLLEQLGGIPFCRTNLPQACLSIGSDNPIWGMTLNPLNKKLSPGGSSSGTASLVAAGGCHFGIGTDSGGSLRIPAHCCGLSTLRSTSNRISDKGCLHCSPNLTIVPGILTKNPEDLAFIYEAMISLHYHHPLDARVPMIPWNDSSFKSKKSMKIGYFTSIKGMTPIGDIETVVIQAKSHLQRLGHELVPFEMPDHSQCWGSFTFNDTMRKHFLKSTKNDAIGDSVRVLHTIFRFDPILKPFLKLYMFVMNLFGTSTPFGTDHPLFMELEKESLTLEILKRMEKLGIDLLLCPTFPYPPVAAEAQASVGMKLMYSTIYCYIWNLVNFPAGVVKFGSESGVRWPKSDPIFNEAAKQESIGMPIGVQIVGKPFQEESVLRVLNELKIDAN